MAHRYARPGKGVRLINSPLSNFTTSPPWPLPVRCLIHAHCCTAGGISSRNKSRAKARWLPCRGVPLQGDDSEISYGAPAGKKQLIA